MPYSDPKKKDEAQRRWRKGRSPAYFKWLYDRRAFRFWKAEKFEWVLEQIATGSYSPQVTPAQLASTWLDEASKKEQEIGFLFDHEKDKPTNQPPSGRRGRTRIPSGDTD